MSELTGPKPRLVFHVGSHKTGTTALQHHFAAHRSELAEAGVLYPDVAPAFGTGSFKAHFKVITALATQGPALLAKLASFTDDLVRKAGRFRTIFLSAETAYRRTVGNIDDTDETAFWAARKDLLLQLRSAFSAFDLSFILCLRRPDTLAEAYYAETIAATDELARFDAYIAKETYRYQYRRQIDLFRSVAPTTLLTYETVRNTGLIAAYCDCLGIPRLPEPRGFIRRSISVRAQAWMRQFNFDRYRACRSDAVPRPMRGTGPVGADRERDRRWRFALAMGDDAPFEGPPATFWMSEAQRHSFVTRALEDVPELVFPPLAPLAAVSCEWGDERHSRAEMAYRGWLSQSAGLIAACEAANLKPFEGPLRPR